jgi:glycosyltransferase involved in cell wall biosynthesis
VVVDDASDPPPYINTEPCIPDEVTLMGFLTNQGVQVARNTGFNYLLRHNCDFVLFSDSDVIWAPNALNKLVNALVKGPGRRASYAYCNWNWGGKDYISKPFNGNELQKSNYISTMSVIRTKDLLKYAGTMPFDEGLVRLQDWDLWLTLHTEGCMGIHVPEILFNTQYSMAGISGVEGYQEALNAVTEKHHL